MVTQSSLQLPSGRDGPGPPPRLCARELHGGKGLEGTPRLQRTVQLHLEVQPLADRLVSTQLASSEAVRKLGSRDCSHPGTQLSASTDAQPRSGLSWP